MIKNKESVRIKATQSDKQETLVKTLKERDLFRFYGTEQYFKHWLGIYIYTDGIKYLAEHGKAHWLIDEIVFYQKDLRIKNDEMLQSIQFWNLIVNKDSTAELICERDEGDVALKKDIDYTDFPLEKVTIYVQENVILLPSEY
ncbi:MAG: hypothetical protein KME15_16380 [Drouetiella hepatica Uher 2000/2452]|jgi:hypothetical protein|uniref:DUF6876 domain-containing protein n=1 Tax=Drouetiella hepatica Uher 2000/2452 TaxID=904376 RepID=A0A951QCH6_9CYAN|nr:hypothetical protein [Drouetiella hepatica Uher 2000/2452]